VNVADTQLDMFSQLINIKRNLIKNEGTYVTAEVQLLEGDEWSSARHGHFIPGAHCAGGSMGSKNRLNSSVQQKISCPCCASNPGLSSP
jgi:hypothetical protein